MTPRASVTNPASGAAKARERVEELRKWLTVMERDNWSYPTRLASADLLAIIEDYSALKADFSATTQALADALNAAGIPEPKEPVPVAEGIGLLKAENERLTGANKMLGKTAVESLAELAKQAPLIEAVMGAERLRYVNLWKNLPTEQVFSNDGIRAILRAAHALREEK